MDHPISDPDAAFRAARAAHDAKDWTRASELWLHVRSLNHTALAWSENAVALRESGDSDAAEAIIVEALLRFPDFLGAFIVWADLAMRRRDWPEAVLRWSELRRRFPKDGQGYVIGSHALREMGRMRDADQVLELGTQNMPHDPWVMASWGYFAQHHLNADEALRRFAIVRQQVPNNPVGYVTAAVILRDQQRHLEAEALLAGALARFPNDAGPLIDFASIAQVRGDHNEAIDRWRLVRERFPEHQAGYANAAGALRAAGRADEAEALMAAARDRFPDNPHLHFEYGFAANARGAWPEAARRWGAIRAQFPDQSVPYVEEARALQALERSDEAEAIIDAARHRFSDVLGIALAWADLAMRRRDWSVAAMRWQSVRAQFPHDVSAVLEGGRALQDAGQVDEAEVMLSDAMRRFADHVGIARAWAGIAMRRQIWPQAASRWAGVRQRFPDDVASYVEGARALRLAGHLPDAEALLQSAVDRFPANPSIRFTWAEMASERADWLEAHRRWEEVRAQFPTETRPYIDAANALGNLVRNEDADALLEQGLARHPANLDIMFHWALLGGRHKPSDVLLARWQRIRDTFSDYSHGYTFGAHALQDHGQPEMAKALVTEAVRRFPNNAEVARCAAEIAARRGELNDAADWFATAAHQNPGDISITRRWIETLDALQRHDDARDALDGALRIWPSEPAFLRRRAMLDIKTGRFESAYTLWQSVIARPDQVGPLGYEIAWAIFGEAPPEDIARGVMLYLIQEPDTGARDWLPVLAGMIQLRGLKPALADLARRIIDAAPDATHDPATMDVLRCALLFEYSDAGITHFLCRYVATGRVALTAHLFCQNYWKTKQNMFERFTDVFERYMTDKLADPVWVREDNAIELLAYLNFAAVHSETVYARLVGEMRARLDLAAMHGQGLHTVPGAAANIVMMTRIDAPAVHTEPRRLRVAICVSGQLRGFQQAMKTWEHLRLEQHDVSVYVHVWKAIGRNWQRIWFFTRANDVLYGTLVGPNGLPFLRGRYPSLAEAAEAAAAASNEATEAQLRDIYQTPHVRIEDDNRDQFRHRHNLWKMHYKVDRAHQLAREDGRAFDLMIRLRPDREFLPGDAPDWNAIHAQSRDRRIIFTDAPYLYTERQTWLGDQFAVGTPEVMDVYSGIWSDMEGFTRAGAFPPDVPDHIRPHTNLFYLCFYRGLIGRMMPDARFGALLDPAMLSVDDVLALLRADTAGRTLDDFDRQFIGACETALAGRRR